jgi:hypothetical protein
MGRSVKGRGTLHRFLGLIFLVLWLAPALAKADEGDDDMFTNPEAGIIEQPNEGLDINALTSEKKPHFSGSMEASGGMVLGISDWEKPITELGAIAAAPFYDIQTTLKLDVRPASFVRIFASVKVESPYDDPATEEETAIAFSPVLVDELFLDYTLADLLYFRVGKQEITWGQGRLFNPGDFLSNADDGISIKGFLPLGANGLTLVGLGEGVLGPAAPAYDDVAELIAAAGLFEASLSRLTFGLSAYFRMAPGLRTGAYLKAPIVGMDFALESVLEWGQDPAAVDSAAVLASLFWEGGRHKWQLILEYLFDTAVPEYLGHSVGLGILARNWLPGGWKPGLRWVHSFADVSGQFLLGLDGPIARYLRLAVAFPIRYGNSAGYYTRYLVSELPGAEYLDRFENGEIPGNPAAAVLVMLRLSIDF